MQVNKQALFTSARRAASNGGSVGMVLVPVEKPCPAVIIKELLKKSVTDFDDESGQFRLK